MAVSDLCIQKECSGFLLCIPAFRSVTLSWLSQFCLSTALLLLCGERGGIYMYIAYIFWSTWMVGFTAFGWWVLKNTEQYVKSGGREITRTVSGNDSSVSGGGVMAQHRLRGPGPTHGSECVSGGSTTSALVWLSTQGGGQPHRSTLGNIMDGTVCILPKYLKVTSLVIWMWLSKVEIQIIYWLVNQKIMLAFTLQSFTLSLWEIVSVCKKSCIMQAKIKISRIYSK